MLQIWSVAGPLVGVIAGGVMAGAFGLWAEYRSHVNTRGRAIAELRRAEYFSAIDSVHRVRQCLERFRAAMSGRWQPETDDTSQEAQEMRARDQEGADSFDALTTAIDGLRSTTYKVRAVGSENVVTAIEALDLSVGEYFFSILDEHGFVAARFDEFFEGFKNGTSALLRIMRSDLEIDRVYPRR
jgi:hypothetical protein